ncbi:uncharacterized protein LY89DRAFT_733418 [Mollisia scopiformis]|uniref:Uncharacterized protein n=1 Tax=Mollisia scopiformis TaxID=149040 RepID=A0A194XCU5_MOLSC|nr:uncharacterized protein LY89DRAFT_733418 [Mollisia scopiformis]KUJ17577.1 hypothetical protein LY89DRAFT_733418 [Mollisia scopiformis]
MATNVYDSNGWDMIAATTQDDITLGAPQLQVKVGSGSQVDVLIPITGSIKLNGTSIELLGQEIIVTTDLLQVEAEVDPHPGENQTTYDLMFNLREGFIVDINLEMPAAGYAFLIIALKQIIKDYLGTGKQYILASFTLTAAEEAEYKPLIPRLADFTFVYDPTTPSRSNFLVLMQTVSPGLGNMYFNAPILAPTQDYLVLVSNRLFLEYIVMPALITGLKKEIINTDTHIELDKDNDPWISKLTGSIDTSMQALELFLEYKADVTFVQVHVDAWDNSWQQFAIDDQGNITLKQINEEQNKSTILEWWKWLIAGGASLYAVIAVGIIDLVVTADAPGLGGTFADIGTTALIKWPNQKTIVLKSITTPGHIVMDLEVSF